MRRLSMVGAGAVLGLMLAGCTPPAGSDPVVDVAVGQNHSCAVRRSGIVLCWGRGSSGELGNGTNTNSTTPVTVSNLSDATKIASYGDFTCVIHKSSGTVSCWGFNSDGQLGDGNKTDSNVPVPVTGLTNAVAIAAGDDHACALISGGAIECWGYNGWGQLGNGTTLDSLTPVAVTGPPVWTAVAAGGNDTCAIDTSAHASCWGEDSVGELGNGLDIVSPYYLSGPSYYVTTALAGPPLAPVSSISVGNDHGCAVVANQGYCWGAQDEGQLGNGVISGASSTAAVQVSGFNKAGVISSAFGFSCSTLAFGGVNCWGSNNSGDLGDGTTMDSTTPVVATGLTSMSKVSVSGDHACALRSDGSVSCWGSNAWGGVGNGTTTDQHSPVKVL
jgi:hypothetical protein